ncbi:hypothetical protein B0H17DRAFT_1120176, partial [Mycena rosella]
MVLFWRQFAALFWKNWIVLSKHPFLNILRCFLSQWHTGTSSYSHSPWPRIT